MDNNIILEDYILEGWYKNLKEKFAPKYEAEELIKTYIQYMNEMIVYMNQSLKILKYDYNKQMFEKRLNDYKKIRAKYSNINIETIASGVYSIIDGKLSNKIYGNMKPVQIANTSKEFFKFIEKTERNGEYTKTVKDIKNRIEKLQVDIGHELNNLKKLNLDEYNEETINNEVNLINFFVVIVNKSVGVTSYPQISFELNESSSIFDNVQLI